MCQKLLKQYFLLYVEERKIKSKKLNITDREGKDFGYKFSSNLVERNYQQK